MHRGTGLTELGEAALVIFAVVAIIVVIGFPILDEWRSRRRSGRW